MESTQTGAVSCCENPNSAAAGNCKLCEAPICSNCRQRVNDKLVCKNCLRQVVEELKAENAGAEKIPMAIFGGVAGSILGGVGWALISILTGFAIGYVAVGVGFLTGYGVFYASGKKKGRTLQIIAVASSLLGLVIGKYFIVAHAVRELIKKEDPNAELPSYVSGKIIGLFAEHFSSFFRPFDILWIVLAFLTAWRILKPTHFRIISHKRGT